MTTSPVDPAAPADLPPLLGTLNLLPGDQSAGYCADGVCHLPAPGVPAQKAE